MTTYRPTVVGSVHVPDPVMYVDRSFPTASWWRELELAPGTYDLVATYSWEDAARLAKDPAADVRPYTLRVSLTGITTDEYFVNRVLQHSSVAEKKLGAVHTVVLSCYGYQADRLAAALGLPDADITWLPVPAAATA